MKLIKQFRHLLLMLNWSRRLYRLRRCPQRWLPEQLEVRALLSTVTLSGTSGNDVITFQQTDATHDTFTLNGTPTTFSTSGVTAITINSAAGSDQITVLSDHSGIPLTVAGSGADTVYVGNAGSVQGIKGTLILSGTTGQMTLTADDSADTTARTVNVFTTAVNFLAPAPIQFTSGQLAFITLKGGSGGNTFHVFNVTDATPVTIDGGSGINTLIGPNENESWSITGANAGSLRSTNSNVHHVIFTNFQNLTGGSAVNDFALLGGSVSGLITGGANDFVDYWNYQGPATSITVNLSTTIGTASFTGGVTGIRNVYGASPIPNTITASPDGSIIYAGSGKNTLIGGIGNDDFIFGYFPGSTTTVDGGGGSNTLTDQTFYNYALNVTGANSGTFGGSTFTNIQNLMGGPAGQWSATFAFSSGGSLSGTIDGGKGSTTLQGQNGANTWNITGKNSGSYDGMSFVNISQLLGGTASDTFSFGTNGTNIGIDGGGGNNTIIGANEDYVWNIAGNNLAFFGPSGTEDFFQNTQNVTGGGGNDTFVFKSSFFVSGTINGGGGTNTLDYSGRSSAVSVNLQNGSATGIGHTANVQNVVGSPFNDQLTAAAAGSVISGDGGNDTLIGGAGSDTFMLAGNQGASTIVNGAGGSNTLVGPNVANSWNMTSSGGGTLNGATFAGIQNLIGGTASDQFAFGPAGILSGTLNGGGGNDTLDYSGRSVGVSVNLQTNSVTAIGGGVTNVQTVIGTPDNDQIIAAAGGTVISGDGGNDTLLGGAGNDTFILASNQGSSTYVNGSSGTNMLIGPNVANTWHITSGNGGTLNGATFANIQNLAGGTANDSFAFGPSGFVSGTLNGGGGADSLDYSGRSSDVVVNLQSNSATAIGGGFSNIGSLIGPTGSDTLVGANATNTWNLTGANAGTIGTLAYSGIENLTGETGNDTFALASGGSVTGLIRGGGGVDTLDYSALTMGVMVDLSHGAAAGTGGVSAVPNVIGSQGNDSITAAAGGSLITANGGVDTLIGGPGNDTFMFSTTPGAGTNVDGRGGANTLVAPNTVNTWNMTSGGGGTLDGAGFSNIQNLTGGSGNDSFAFGPAGFVSGAINGGTGGNTLDFSGRTVGVQVNLQANSATGVGGGFSNISSLIGSSGSDLLIGANTTNTWNVTGQNSGNVNGLFSFSGIENLTGGFGVDSFVLSNGAGITGTINGGNTTGDWLDDSAYTTPVTVNLATGTTTNIGGVTNIQNVRGGNGGNTLTGDSVGNIMIGGSGVDTIVGGSGRSVLIGDGGADSVTGGAADDIVIGGTTSYDASSVANNAALASILAEWQLSSSYALRIAEINGSRSGGLNGTNDLIFGTTVQDDGAANTLTGGAGMDWFFKGANDNITDLQAGEQIN